MWGRDQASRSLGMVLQNVSPGRATLTMIVTADMVNGFGMCHGGSISTLADSAFAFACNTYGTLTVATSFEVTFLKPCHEGDLLIADAHEVARSGRSGVYDVTVSRHDDGPVAVFRGHSRSLGRPICQEDS